MHGEYRPDRKEGKGCSGQNRFTGWGKTNDGDRDSFKIWLWNAIVDVWRMEMCVGRFGLQTLKSRMPGSRPNASLGSNPIKVRHRFSWTGSVEGLALQANVSIRIGRELTRREGSAASVSVSSPPRFA
jgi:hypothetical protein